MQRVSALRVLAVGPRKNRHPGSLHLENDVHVFGENLLTVVHVLLVQLQVISIAVPKSPEHEECRGLPNPILRVQTKELLGLLFIESPE